MRRTAAAVLVALGLMVAMTACEPTSTTKVSSGVADKRPGCGSVAVVFGTVTPAGASRTVALQRTVSGSWTDWKQSPSTGQPAKLLTGTVGADGAYTITYQVPFQTSPLHLRVRTAGNGAYSPGLYVTPTEYDTGQCG